MYIDRRALLRQQQNIRLFRGLICHNRIQVMLKFGLSRPNVVLRSLAGRMPTLWLKNHVPP